MSDLAFKFLDRAHKLAEEADALLGINLFESAGRTAYMVAFHTAQALIEAKGSRLPKTHKGTHGEFFRITEGDRRIDPELRIFLSRSYNLKAIADYELGPDATLDRERAESAVEQAKHFLSTIEAIVQMKDA